MTSTVLGARGLHALMVVFPIRWQRTKVASPGSAGIHFVAQKASVEPVIARNMLCFAVSASVLPEDLYPVKLPAIGTGPQGRAARPSGQHGNPNGHATCTGCEVRGSGGLEGVPRVSSDMLRRLAA